MQKTYVGFSRDHSGSMRNIAHLAARDYNDQLATIKQVAQQNDQDIIVSVVTIGVGSQPIVGREVVNSNVHVLKPMAENAYAADAHATPMIDSVFELIKIMRAAPDANDPNVSFMVMITTDGQENVSRGRGRELAALMRQLQATDRWTFAFRVPRNGVRELAALGITGVSVLEWDQTAQGVKASTEANVEAFTEYFHARKSGVKSTRKFYANLEDVDIEQLQKQLVDISDQVTLYDVLPGEVGGQIRDVVEAKIGKAMVKGGAFYQLVKTEPKVQDNKRIAIRDRSTGVVFAGDAARAMLALPKIGTVRLAPDELGDFDVFIQSTSVNRKLDANTQLLYWPAVGVAFKEGVSAR